MRHERNLHILPAQDNKHERDRNTQKGVQTDNMNFGARQNYKHIYGGSRIVWTELFYYMTENDDNSKLTSLQLGPFV